MPPPNPAASPIGLVFVTNGNLLDDALESAGDRALLIALQATGMTCRAVCRFLVDADETEPERWLKERNLSSPVKVMRTAADTLLVTVSGVEITFFQTSSSQPKPFVDAELTRFISLAEGLMSADRPTVLATRTGSYLTGVLHAARQLGVPSMVLLPDCGLLDPGPLRAADVVVSPTRLAADYLRDAFGLASAHLPPVAADAGKIAPSTGVVFDGTVAGCGLTVFAQIASAVSRRRPGTVFTLIGGHESIPLPGGGEIRCVPRTAAVGVIASADVVVAPLLGWEPAPLAVVAAVAAGVPVVASDRGAIPELLDGAGVVLPLPDRLTTTLPVAVPEENLTPWVEAVLRLLSDGAFAARQRGLAQTVGRRYSAAEPAVAYHAFISKLIDPKLPASPPDRSKWVALVPHLSGIEWECEQGLRQLEAAGVRVVRKAGSSAIDVARNELLSDALHGGAESILFIDSDIGFDFQDALRLLARPESVISGVYAKKLNREVASTFADGVKEVLFGPDALGPYPLRFAATGFLRVRAPVLRRMIAELRLPLCNTHWGRGIWPFFQPVIIPHGEGKWHYLGEDWAFSHRLAAIGVVPLADTTIRLWHWGRYGFGWEDAGKDVERFRSYSYHIT